MIPSTDRPHVFVLSTADWSAPLWTNNQYMACELAAGFGVTYVESLGMRRPRLSRRDAVRMARRVRSSLAGGASSGDLRPRPAGLRLASPLAIPFHRGPAVPANRAIVRRVAREWLGLPRHRRVLWTYAPTAYGLEQEAATVYHCVDLTAEVPGIDPRVVAAGERRLADSGAVAVSSSREVTAHLHRVGFSQVIEWPNVAEVAPYIDAASGRPPRDPELVVFGGNISPFKIDCEMIAELIRRRPHVHVVLAGPIPGGGAGWKGLDDLRELGVELVGLKSIAELAELYARATVGIIPYVETPYTRGVLPLKVNEYLAAGLSVVASNLASMSELGEDVVLARGPADFADKVIARLGPLDSADVERRQQFAARHSWVQRGDDARRLVADLLEGEGPRP